MMLLTRRTISSALRPPYPYGGELVSQFLFTLQQVWFPLREKTAEALGIKIKLRWILRAAEPE